MKLRLAMLFAIACGDLIDLLGVLMKVEFATARALHRASQAVAAWATGKNGNIDGSGG